MIRTTQLAADATHGDSAGAAERQATELWQRLRSQRQCTLTTRTPYGELHSRSLRLQNRALHAGDPLWFFIERGGDLVLDVGAHPEVDLSFGTRDGCRIAIHGQATVVGSLDRAAFQASQGGWHLPCWRHSEDERRLALLRVDIEQLRYIDAPGPQARGNALQGELAFA